MRTTRRRENPDQLGLPLPSREVGAQEQGGPSWPGGEPGAPTDRVGDNRGSGPTRPAA